MCRWFPAILVLAIVGAIFPANASVGKASRVGAGWQFIDQKGAPVPDVVVSLFALDAGVAAPAPGAANPVEVTQRNKTFVPYVTVIAAGGSVAFPNRDSVQHHVYSLSRAKRFEIPLYGKEETQVLIFDKPGVITLGCNIHDWMVGYIVVVDTPYFGRSGEDGRVQVAGLPAGRYRVEIWHPRLAAKEFSIEAAVPLEGEAALAPISLRLKRDLRRTGPLDQSNYP